MEKISGVKAHTIRMWEQRYDLILPKRTPTNIRYYQDSDLKRLLNIVLLKRQGMKISKVAKFSDQELARAVATITDTDRNFDMQLDALMLSMLEMDEYKFDKIITSSIHQLGFERSIFEVIHPFLDKLGILWLTGSINPVQENFISNLLRQKVIAATDKLPILEGRHIKKVVLYLPPGENQEISLLLMQYLLKSRNYHVVYLGMDIGVDDLEYSLRFHQPDYLFTIISEAFSNKPLKPYIDHLLTIFSNAQLLFTGVQLMAQKIHSTDRLTVLQSLDSTIILLDEWSSEAPGAAAAL